MLLFAHFVDFLTILVTEIGSHYEW